MTAANKDKITLAATAATAKTTSDDAAKKVVDNAKITHPTPDQIKTAATDKTAASTAASALTTANDAVAANAAKIVQLGDRKATGAAILANTYQAH